MKFRREINENNNKKQSCNYYDGGRINIQCHRYIRFFLLLFSLPKFKNDIDELFLSIGYTCQITHIFQKYNKFISFSVFYISFSTELLYAFS